MGFGAGVLVLVGVALAGRRAALASRTHGCGVWRRVLGSGGAACVRGAWLAWCAALWRGVHCAGAACSP